MVQPLNYLKESPSQTAGPYVHIGCTPNFTGITGVYDTDLGSGPMTNDKTRGERITIKGRVIDGSGTPLRDAMIEIW
jgi:protocatechuate 3,4-dioxygenase, alpha subunit